MIPHLTTRYLGLQPRNPVIIGASPFSDSLIACAAREEAGASAIVLRSLFAEQFELEQRALVHPTAPPRRALLRSHLIFPALRAIPARPRPVSAPHQAPEETPRIPVMASRNRRELGSCCACAGSRSFRRTRSRHSPAAAASPPRRIASRPSSPAPTASRSSPPSSDPPRLPDRFAQRSPHADDRTRLRVGRGIPRRPESAALPRPAAQEGANDLRILPSWLPSWRGWGVRRPRCRGRAAASGPTAPPPHRFSFNNRSPAACSVAGFFAKLSRM